MDHSKKIEKVVDKALSAGGLAAKLFGIVDVRAATVGILADCIQQRRSKKFLNRLEKLVQSIDQRVSRLEDEHKDEPDVDLMDEIIAKAISDEDEEKTEYYAALIEYYASHSITPQEVRLLGNAFKSLLLYEIEGFAAFVNGDNFTRNVPHDLVPIFWNRVHFLGLYKAGNGVKHISQVSQLGRVFVDICRLAHETYES